MPWNFWKSRAANVFRPNERITDMTWMIAMVIATNASLSAVLLRPDQSVTADLVWPSREECEVVRDAHLAVKPSPDHIGMVCVSVPKFIADQYISPKPPVHEI